MSDTINPVPPKPEVPDHPPLDIRRVCQKAPGERCRYPFCDCPPTPEKKEDQK